MTELTITPLADIFDLLLGIGLIALGLSILAVVITVEIYHFRKGGLRNEGNRCRKNHGERPAVHSDRIAERVIAFRMGYKNRP